MIKDAIKIIEKVNHGISVIKWLLKPKNPSKRLDTSKMMTNLKNMFYKDKEIQDIMKKDY